jgi:hypothetical protein
MQYMTCISAVYLALNIYCYMYTHENPHTHVCVCVCYICYISSAIYLLVYTSRLRVEDAPCETSPNPSPAGGIDPRNSGGAEPQRDHQASRPLAWSSLCGLTGGRQGGGSTRPSQPYLDSVSNHIYTASDAAMYLPSHTAVNVS